MAPLSDIFPPLSNSPTLRRYVAFPLISWLDQPEIPIAVSEPPTGAGWIHEIRYDGYRTLIVIDGGQVRAFTWNGNDWTRVYRRGVDACGKLKCESALIDGEMVVQDESGLSDFDGLRSAIHKAPHRIVLLAFDPAPPQRRANCIPYP